MLIASLAVTILTSAGCERSHDDRTVVDFWAMGREGELVQPLLDEFERQNPDIAVRVQQIPWSAAHEKLLTAYAGDAMPDVFQLGSTWIPEFAAIGALLDLGPSAAGSIPVETADFFAGIVSANRIDGRLLGIPWYVDTRVVFYRADILQAAGYERLPATWQEWLDAMAAVKGRLGPGHYAILLPIIDPDPLIVFALQTEGELLREGDRYAAFDRPAFRRALDFYLRIFENDLAPVTSGGQTGNLYQEFARGRFAMFISGPWSIGEIRRRLPTELQDAWRTAPMPAPKGLPNASIAGGASLAIAADTPHAGAAWRLVAYLAAPEQQLRFYRLSDNLPARRTAWALGRLPQAPGVAAFWEQLDELRAPPKIPEWEQIAEAIGGACEALARGETEIDAALASLQARVDQILEKRRWLLARREQAEP
jgi:multiple sugar transport system substrate-binding protein